MARRKSFSASLLVDLSKVDDITDTGHLDHGVSRSDIVCADHAGWLTDLTTGLPQWCIIADMLFCVFENDDAEKSSKVLMLPGYTIRPVVYNSATKDTYHEANNVHKRSKGTSKTISGMERFQIVIENDITGQKIVYSTNTQANLDRWISILKVASSLDTDILNSDSENDNENRYEDEIGGKYSPSSPRDIKRSDITLSWLNGYVKSEDSHSGSGSKSPAVVHKIGHISKLNNTFPQNGKWCSTREELINTTTKKLVAPVIKRSGKSTSAIVKSKENVVDRLPQRPKSAMFSHELPEEREKRNSRVISVDDLQERKGIGKKISRRASLLKEKVFKGKSSKTPTDPENVKLGTLQDVKISGYLSHKYLLSWRKHWCAICSGKFYVFKSKNTSESPEFTITLEKYFLILQNNDKNKKPNTFKLTAPRAKSIHLAALDSFDFNRWIEIFKSETMESPENSVLSTPELSRWDATTRRYESMPSINNLLNSDTRRGSEQSKTSSESQEHQLAYPDSPAEEDRSSNTSSMGFENSLTKDSSPRHDQALLELWKARDNQENQSPTLSRSTGSPNKNIIFKEDVILVNDDEDERPVSVTDERPSSNSSYSSADVFNKIPSIMITDAGSETPEIPIVDKNLLTVTRKLSVSKSVGDLPELCKSCEESHHSESRLNELNLEYGRSAELNDSESDSQSQADEAEKIWQQDLLNMKKQQLLQDLMKQKAEIERRQQWKDTKTIVVPNQAEMVNKYQRTHIEKQQEYVRDMTHLKQRRLSTQLKVNTIEKQLTQETSNNNVKKHSVFSFGGKPKSTLINQDHKHLQNQLQELKNKLADIDKGLNEHEKQREETLKHLISSESNAVQRHEQLKASLGAIMEVVESPKLHRNHLFEDNSSGGSSESSPNIRRRTRASTVPLKADTRRSSGVSTRSDPCNSIGESKINPDTLAQIEAFEEMTKKVLQQKSGW